jgi:ferredoxin
MAPYSACTIYYFTGTGNALTSARWMRETAQARGVPTKLIPIDRGAPPEHINENALIGFLYPTHGFNLAPSMMYFIFKFPRSRTGAHAFLGNTRAGGKLFKWITPGLSGAAQILPMLVLALKGYSVRGGLPIDMPSNWISIHPGYPPSWIAQITAHCKKAVNAFMGAMLDGRRRFRGALVSLPLDIAILPVAVLYYFIGRFFLAKLFVYSSACNDCGICVKNCPVGAVVIRAGKPYWRLTCESCMRCINNCPQKAINASHLLFGIYLIIAQIPFALWIFDRFSGLSLLKNIPLTTFIIDAYVPLGIFIVLYALVQRLLKNRAINAVFTRTSLTHYWRRYLAPGIRLRDYSIRKDGGG